MDKKLIVLSFDAVGGTDLDFLETLPNFGRLMKEGAVCKKVQSVYPSLTYPAHTSIITGRYPVHHKIVNNVKIQPGRNSPDWFWQRADIQGTTLYDEAAKVGKKVAALLWPVTGKSPSISYHLPEVLPNRPWENQILVSLLNGSPLYEMELQRKFGSIRDGISQPQLDDFVQASLIHTLRRYEPDLTLVHLTDADTQRHRYGVNSPQAKEALMRHDRRLGEVMTLVEEPGWKGRTNLVVLGDHYQKDVHTVLYPNRLFLEAGHIKVKNGRIVEWNILARDCDGSCYVYVKDKKYYWEAAALLKQMKREWKGIGRILSGKKAGELGADNRCAFMLEAEEGYYFQNGWEKPREDILPDSWGQTAHLQRATHGYRPDLPGYETFFGGMGVDFLPGATAKTMSLVDEGPTLAYLCGLHLGETDGRIIIELLDLK